MGYDMRLTVTPERLTKAQQAYDDSWSALEGLRRGTPEYEAARDKWMKLEDPSYFRLNIFGMGRYRDLMAEVGMVTDVSAPEFPVPPRTEGGDQLDDDDPVYVTYVARCQAITAADGAASVIPTYKFGSNDGWHVTARECEAALQAWDLYNIDGGSYSQSGHAYAKELLGDEGGEWAYWLEWLKFLALGAECDGFEVW